MSIFAKFQPAYGQNQIVNPAAGSVTIAVGTGSKNLMVYNSGANVCYVRVGKGTTAGVGLAAATTADYPIAAGVKEIISKAQDDDSLSHISALGTTLQIMPGEGF